MRKRSLSVLLCCVMALTLLLSACRNGRLEESRSDGDTAASSAEPSAEAGTPTDEPAVPEAQRSPDAAHEASEPAPDDTAEVPAGGGEEDDEMEMTMQVGESAFTATLEENAAVDALVEMMEHGPVTIQMSDYAGFEKVGALGTNLPTSNSQTTTQAGDIVLYQGSQIVLFYGSNSWSYTRLGRIDDLTGWAEALGSGDVSVTFSLAA